MFFCFPYASSNTIHKCPVKDSLQEAIHVCQVAVNEALSKPPSLHADEIIKGQITAGPSVIWQTNVRRDIDVTLIFYSTAHPRQSTLCGLARVTWALFLDKQAAAEYVNAIFQYRQLYKIQFTSTVVGSRESFENLVR